MQNQFITSDEVQRLIEDRRLPALRDRLSDGEPADIAELFEELPREQHSIVFRILPKELAAEVFVEMDADQKEHLITSFSDVELKAVLEELYADDAADIIEEMPANVVKRILRNADPQMRKEVNELLKYPKYSAGSIMTTEYVALKKSMTVDEAFQLIRRVAIDKETIYTCYVTDANRKLLGLVTAKTLMLAPLDAHIEEIMDSSIISAATLDDQEAVAQMFDKYNFLAVPVVDGENRLVGIITVDDAMDVIHEEVEEDFAKMAAITPSEREYLKTSATEIWKKRIPWLLLMMLSATFTGMIISSFENALASCVVLTTFIPMLMGTGGNSGSQSSVTVIRSLSLGEIEFSDLLRVMWKEFRVAILCGATLAAVEFVKILLVDRLLMGGADINVWIAFIVALTLCITVLCAKLIGCVLPMVAKKIGFDPAVMASPFITTLVDALSLLVYFRIAASVLHF